MHATSLQSNREGIDEVVGYTCPLIFLPWECPKYELFQPFTTELLVLFADQIRLKPLYVNAFIINQQALLRPNEPYTGFYITTMFIRM